MLIVFSLFVFCANKKVMEKKKKMSNNAVLFKMLFTI